VGSGAGARMLGMLPGLVAGADAFRALLGAEGAELDAQEARLAQAWGEANPLTASAAGIAVLEEMYGLGVLPTDDLEARRSRVLGFLRTRGTATPARVKAVANSFENGEVAPIEDFRNRRLILRFMSVLGVPPNLEAMLAAVRRIVPEDTQLVPEYRFSIWAQVDEAGLTWDQFDALGLTWDQFDARDWVNA
jgi:hypothetical protein